MIPTSVWLLNLLKDKILKTYREAADKVTPKLLERYLLQIINKQIGFDALPFVLQPLLPALNYALSEIHFHLMRETNVFSLPTAETEKESFFVSMLIAPGPSKIFVYNPDND